MLKVQEIREIIRLVDKSSITEFNYNAEGTSISIKKTEVKQNEVVEQVVQNTPQTVIETPKAAVAEVAVIKEEEATNEDVSLLEIVSPMVGTFYSKPNPESDAYVSVGHKVGEETIVCIVEAMKLFNEIEAEVNGEIVEVLVEDGELVEYGQPLFKVKSN